MALKIYMGVLLLFMAGNLAWYIWKPDLCEMRLRTIRKALYTLFLASVAAGLMVGEIGFADWQAVLFLMLMTVFTDVALLLTPNILKIGNAEFQYDSYIENVVKENQKVHAATLHRVQSLSEIIQRTDEYIARLPAAGTGDFVGDLQRYLEQYSRIYGFSIRIWRIEPKTMDAGLIPIQTRIFMNQGEIIEMLTGIGIESALDEMERWLTVDFGDEKEDYVASLMDSAIVTVPNEEMMIVPVYLGDVVYLILLKNERGQLYEVDGIHIANLAHLFSCLVKEYHANDASGGGVE